MRPRVENHLLGVACRWLHLMSMFFFLNPYYHLPLALTLCICTLITCQSGCESIYARVGELLQLYCSTPCLQTSWWNGSRVIESGYSYSYLVTSNLTISEIRGQNYSCVCEENNQRQCFSVWVYPEISLTFSSNPVRIGSTVNVTCTAVSYPQADPETDYIIQHPIGLSVVHTHIAPGLSGIIYEIGSAIDNDNGTYTCHVIVIRMDRGMTNEKEEHLVVTNVAVPPEPTLKYYNHTIELNQPVLLNCSVSAVPRPEFQWILADTEEPLPESSWNSTTYVNKTAISTLNYMFTAADLNEYCKIHIVCIATNPYVRSEQHFTLSLKSSESYVLPSISLVPSATWDDYINNTSIIKSSSTLTINSNTPPIDFVNTVSTISYEDHNTLEIQIIAAIFGAILCLALILVTLTISIYFCKHTTFYFKSNGNHNKDQDAVEMCDNPAYQEINTLPPEINHTYMREFHCEPFRFDH